MDDKNTFNLDYSIAITEIKNAVLQSRYRAASLANRELLLLYFNIGEYISENTRNKNWGKGAIEIISNRLQQELPGLRGFSATNLKNMRIFYEEWKDYIPITLLIKPIGSNGIDNHNTIRQLPTDVLKLPSNDMPAIRQLATDEFTKLNIDVFFRLSFTHHLLILNRITSHIERFFYIRRSFEESWSVDKLKYNIASDLFNSINKLQNNFQKTIESDSFRSKAINSFKDELLLDFINITDPDEEIDERVLEHSIVNNIKKFIMALGNDFCFIGNQYRLLIDEEEFFIDLLFFNRKLQSLVAIELKKGKFKAEYVGKMNLYLSALDEYVRQPHENPTIGIILCKEKNNKIVEFAFRDTSKPMGVMTYKNTNELPEKYRNILPNEEELKKLF